MSDSYPQIRVYAEDGALILREGLSFSFYMKRPHREVVPSVIRSLEIFLQAVGHRALSRYIDDDGGARSLDRASLSRIIQSLQEMPSPIVQLLDAPGSQNQFRFEYYGKSANTMSSANGAHAVCAVSFWLPTEYLATQGPSGVRELGLELASSLPFCSGHGGLSFNGELDLMGVPSEVAKRCFVHPGMDIPVTSRETWKLGTRVRGPHWLTFLGQPVLGELGDTAGLSARLHTSSTSVLALDRERAVVTLGTEPEAGDTDAGQVLPAYRELASVLGPQLYAEADRVLDFSPEDSRRWHRRFVE